MKLFESYQMGPNLLKNKIVMAPMTRGRALSGGVPNPISVTYYSDRASAGLIITEATQVSPQGVGYIRTPGIHSSAQVEGWKKITDAVHERGGRIFLQLWHVGRISHPDFHDGALPVAPSAIKPEGEVFTYQGKKPMVTPRALEIHEIPLIVEQFAKGAENAKLAGFDGVEIHGANGYLLDQFLRDGTNIRTDRYGGVVENRARLPLEVTDAVIAVWGADRVGYRVSPKGTFNSMSDSNPEKAFGYLAAELEKRGICYLHVPEHINASTGRVTPLLRKAFKRTLIANEGYNKDLAEQALVSRSADLISFGAPFISNSDLPERFLKGLSLNEPNRATFYTGENDGYNDYPKISSGQ